MKYPTMRCLMNLSIPKNVCVLLAAIVILAIPVCSVAQQMYFDDFSSTLHADMLNTTASWNTTLGTISLHPYEFTYKGSYDTPDRAYGVCISGKYAYVADGDSGLRIIDISNPSVPALAGSYDTSANSQGIAVSGNLVFLADQLNGLLIIDVSNPGAPTLVGSYDTPDRAYRVCVEGNYAFVADRLSGLQIVDISNPSAPILAGSLDTPVDALDVFVSGDYAFVTDNTNGFLVIDISDPAAPSLAGSCATPAQAYSVCVSGDYAYVTDSAYGLLSIDISNPVAPAVVGSQALPAGARGIYVTGTYAYVAGWTDGIAVFDISDPAAPALLDRYGTTGSAMDIVVAGELAYIADWEAGLQIVNVAGLILPPEYVSGYITDWSAAGIRVDGTMAYVADQSAGMQIIDIADASHLQFKANYAITGVGSALQIDISGNYAYIAASNGGLHVVDISDPADPALAAIRPTLSVANDIVVDGNHAYIAADIAGVQVFDITDPANPAPSGSFATAGAARGIAVAGDYAYAAVSASGLQIVDISDPAHPAGVGIFSGGHGIAVAVSGRYAYLAGDNYFRIIDITNPASPTQLGSYYTGQSNTGVAIEGGFAFLAANASGLMVFDISNPANPLPVGSNNSTGIARDVTVAGDFAFAAEGQSGMQVFNIFERTVDRARLAENIVQSSVIDSEDDEIVSVNLFTTQSGGIQWEVSADGGSHWQRVFPNFGWQSITNTGIDLLWRALFLYEQPGKNPRCSSLQIEWCNAAGRVVVYFDAALSEPDTCIASAPIPFVFGYVTAEGISAPITGIEFKIESPPGYTLVGETCPYPLVIGNATNGVSIAFGKILNASNQLLLYTLVYQDLSGTCVDCSLPAGPVTVVPHPNSISGEIEATDAHMNFVYSSGATTYICYAERRDADNDGVPNALDLCPYVSSEYFDRNGDGCVDEVTSARHVEYWGDTDTLTYYISEGGSPNISDGSDIAALTQSMDTWRILPGSDMPVVYGGTTPAVYANAFDQVNMITFRDPIVDDSNNRYFSDAIIAVGITTSFTEPTLHNNRWYRPGEIFDADMLFNPSRIFTTTGGAGIDLQSVATHEAGHLYGLSHSALRTSTMFPVLGSGIQTASLTVEDSLQFLKAYPEQSILATANRIQGTILDFYGNPVHGASVFAVDAASGDTTACEYTLFDGSYQFFGLPNGSYYVAIYPLNGTAGIGYVEPAAINWLVYSWGVTNFIPEYWDENESASDNPLDMTSIPVSGGMIATANIMTNIDLEPPVILETTPANNAAGVRADATILIQFSEPIDHTTLQGNFRLVNTGTNQGVGGSASVLDNGTVLTFSPWDLLAYSTVYACSLRTGIADQFGNTLAAPFEFNFTTEPQPPLFVKNIVPDKGVPGSVVVLNGAGFDTTETNNTVLFTNRTGSGTIAASILSASPNQLVAIVPASAGTGDVTVTVGPSTSQARFFTLLSTSEVVRGYIIGTCNLSSTPRAQVILPDEHEAFVATLDGVSIVGVTPGLPDFCVETAIPLNGGLDDVAATPDGRWVYAVSRSDSVIRVIDPVNRTIPFVLPVGAEPVSITIDQAGRRAYIPTTGGTIQKWDIDETSPTLREPVGIIASPDPNLRSNIAIDPTGELLLALSGAGKMLAFQSVTGAFLKSISIGPDPRDIVIEPTGLRAYITDGSGEITVVSLRPDISSPVDPFKVGDIKTGGSLRKAAVSPAGSYLLAANRELNLIDAVDLQSSNATYRTVVATIPLGINPVQVDLSSRGNHAYSIVEKDQQLVVLGIGVGPALKSISRLGGPDGTRLVFGGSDFGWDADTVSVLFGDRDQNPTVVQPDWTIDTALGVTAPAGVPSGPVSIRTGTGAYAYSNELYFNKLDPTPSPGQIRLVSKIPLDPLLQASTTLRPSPAGNQVIVGSKSGKLTFVDSDLSSPTLNQVILSMNTGLPAVHDIAITPDGRRAYVSFDSSSSVIVVDCNRSSGTYGTAIDTVRDWTPYPLTRPRALAVSPDGGTCLLRDIRSSGWDRIYRIDIDTDSPTRNTALDTVVAAVPLDVDNISYHPGGLYAYAISVQGRTIHIIDMNAASANFRNVVNSITIPGALADDYPLSCSFLPDGSACLVLARADDATLGEHRTIRKLDTSDPANPIVEASSGLVDITTAPPSPLDRIEISPRGDRAVVHCDSLGLYNFDLTADPLQITNSFISAAYRSGMYPGFSPGGSYVYATCESEGNVQVFDFSGADSLAYVSGGGQTGVTGQLAPAPLRVQVTSGGQPSAGVPITFHVESGGGRFVATSTDDQIVATDQLGYAQVLWILGPAIGEQTASASADGLSGSPVSFTVTAIDDPDVLPLQFAGAVPANGAQNVGLTTTIVAHFSRAVDRTTINNSNIFLRKTNETQALPARLGVTDRGKTVSLSPRYPLEINTPYTLEIRAGLKDRSGGSITNPGVSSFVTMPPPPLKLSAVSPPSSAAQYLVVLSGTGFDSTPGDNSIFFNDLPATPVEAGFDYLKVIVPPAAQSGTIKVLTEGQESNTIPFFVLEPVNTTSDKIIAKLKTEAATKSLVINPTGTWAYAISPRGDILIPIDLVNRHALPSIAVGNHPISLAMHPGGTSVYVANSQSGSVSIIHADPDSPDFNMPDTTLTISNYPIDLTVSPDGNRVYVVNAGDDPDQNMDILDSDAGSANYHSVLATIATGTAAKSVVMTPDGSRLYLGTDTGYIVMNALDYGVLATIATGSATKSVIMHPDGGLLFVLTTEGEILIVDIMQGSTKENAVLATIAMGSAIKSVTMTPDGSQLYLIQEELDLIFVVRLVITGSAGVTDPDALYPPVQIGASVIDTLYAGEDPEAIVFDPTGSGLALVVNSGPETITFLSTEAPLPDTIAADLAITPRTLNLKSRGRWVHGSIELDPAFAPGDIDLATVLLQDSIPAELDRWCIEDADSNGVEELVTAFDRVAFQAIMPQGEYVPVWITGMVGDQPFMGTDTIRTIRPTIHYPNGGVVSMNKPITVRWESPQGFGIDMVDVHWSPDDGSSWFPIAVGIPDMGSTGWITPGLALDSCRVMVTIYRNGEDMGMGMNQQLFLIADPVAVAITSFEGSIDAAAAVLRWRTSGRAEISGFHLLRSQTEDAIYERITRELIPLGGTLASGTYEYRDSTIKVNQTYYYKLQQISERGIEAVTGPFKVLFRANLNLGQNIPNPFNPTTTISYTIPEKMTVKLTIHDVQGKIVATLVDDVLAEGFKHAIWDGLDAKGTPVASGVYFYRLKAGKQVLTKKMILLK